MSLSSRSWFLLAVWFVLAAAPAAAQAVVSGQSRAEVVTLLSSMGIAVEDKTEPGELPWLIGNTKSGRTFNIFLYDCGTRSPGPNRRCAEMQFRTLWDNQKSRTAEDMNRFALNKVFGRGYVTADGRSVGVEYAMHFEGGVTRPFIRANILYFLRVVDDFESIVSP
jgi:hypothetical protein